MIDAINFLGGKNVFKVNNDIESRPSNTSSTYCEVEKRYQVCREIRNGEQRCHWESDYVSGSQSVTTSGGYTTGEDFLVEFFDAGREKLAKLVFTIVEREDDSVTYGSFYAD